MKQITVDMADMKLSNDVESEIVTYALGSCIAVVLYEPRLRVGGMIHYMLPESRVAQAKAEAKPAMFADTGVPLLFQESYKFGCKKEDLIVKVIGGGHLFDDNGVFNIGKRNYTVLRKLFWKNGVIITAEDVGGNKSRTVRLSVGTGQVWIRADGETWEL